MQKLLQTAFLRRLSASAGLALAAAVLFAAGPANAQWKWRDKDGHIEVSDRPPPKDIADADILQRPNQRPVGSVRGAAAASSPALIASQPMSDLEREVEARKRAAEKDRLAQLKAGEERVAAQKSENCRRARNQETALLSGQRMARTNSKGEREIVDDKGRADELRAVRDVIGSDCH